VKNWRRIKISGDIHGNDDAIDDANDDVCRVAWAESMRGSVGLASVLEESPVYQASVPKGKSVISKQIKRLQL